MKRLKTSHLAVVGAILLLIANGENIRTLNAKTAATSDRKTIVKDRLKTEKERTQNAKELSKVALERYRANCIMVVDAQTKAQSYFAPGNSAIDTALGKSLRESAMICNALGDTAIVTNGVIENIATITAEDITQANAILESRGYRLAMPTQQKENPKP